MQNIAIKMDPEAQIELENITNKNQLMRRLREVFQIPLIVDHIREQQMPLEFCIDLMCQIALHKRASLSILVGVLHRHFGTSKKDIQTCVDAITAAAAIDLIDYDPISGVFIVAVDIPADVQRDLDRFQYPMPMVVEPRKLTNNRSSAYYTSSGSLILKGHNHHDHDICIEHLNRANQVQLTLNMETVRLIENSWANLDHQKDDETLEDYQDRVAAFQRYDRNARDVIDLMIMAGNRFYLTHKYDKRGRTYAQGHHINTQGNGWNKAVVELANGEIING